MALVLLRLRLAIARRSRGTGNAAQLYLATSWVLGGISGLLAGMSIATILSGSGAGDLLLLAAFCAVFLPWVIGPIVEPTLADGVVDPRRLEQFPLTGWQQVSGLLAGALASPTATFTFLMAAGGAFALDVDPAVRIAAVVVAVAYTLLCVATSRSAQALLAGALGSRRGADVAAIAASLLVLGIYLFAQEARNAVETLGALALDGPIGTVVSWLPPGAAARALLDARDGDWLGFAVRTGVVLATIAGMLGLWIWALGRRVDGITSGRGAAQRRQAAAALPLTPAILKRAPAGPTTAAASQQLRYFFFRSPRAIQTLIIPPVMGVVVAHTSFAPYGLAAQSAAFAGMSVVAGSFNLFGHDGPGFSYLLQGAAPLPKVLFGKALAPLLYLLPLVVAFNVAESVIRGTRGAVGPAVLAGFAVIVLGVGFGALSSVLNPSDQSRVGQRRGSFVKVLSWFMGFFTVVGIGGVVWWLLAQAIGLALTGVLVLALTVAIAWSFLRWAGRRLERDPYTVLRKLDPRFT